MHHQGKFIRHEGGRRLENYTGLNMGIDFSKDINQYVSFVGCRKNGVPVGPEWAWRLDGRRFYYNRWSHDGSGKVLNFRVWDEHGNESGKSITSDCSICTEATVRDDVLLHCSHTFHYKCISKWLDRSNECPVCRSGVCFSVAAQNKRFLCFVKAKDILNGLILVEDIFGNELCMKFVYQHYLPKFHSAENRDLKHLLDISCYVEYDNKSHVLRISNKKGEIYIGNVLPQFKTKKFDFSNRSFLKNNDLESNARLLQPIEMKDFYWKPVAE